MFYTEEDTGIYSYEIAPMRNSPLQRPTPDPQSLTEVVRRVEGIEAALTFADFAETPFSILPITEWERKQIQELPEETKEAVIGVMTVKQRTQYFLGFQVSYERRRGVRTDWTEIERRAEHHNTNYAAERASMTDAERVASTALAFTHLNRKGGMRAAAMKAYAKQELIFYASGNSAWRMSTPSYLAKIERERLTEAEVSKDEKPESVWLTSRVEQAPKDVEKAPARRVNETDWPAFWDFLKRHDALYDEKNKA